MKNSLNNINMKKNILAIIIALSIFCVQSMAQNFSPTQNASLDSLQSVYDTICSDRCIVKRYQIDKQWVKEIIRSKNGVIVEKSFYADSLLKIQEGKAYNYYPNGNVYTEREYLNNKFVGKTIFYTEEGNKDYTLFYNAKGENMSIDIGTEAEFIGGIREMYSFVGRNIIYPAVAQRMNISGIVRIRFKVNKNGALSDFLVVQCPHISLCRECIRLLMSSPKWKPATKGGNAIDSYYTIPINFSFD